MIMLKTLETMQEIEPENFKVLSIDAWGSPEGWQWNQWYTVGEIPKECLAWKPRKLFKWLRENGFLGDKSAGKISWEDDQYNIVIKEKSNDRPLFAIEYGSDPEYS
jgi:phage antirepressor YoqD-like protein